MLKAKAKRAKPARRTALPAKAAVEKKVEAMSRARHQRARQFAKANPPPQAWFEQTDCPFTPTRD